MSKLGWCLTGHHEGSQEDPDRECPKTLEGLPSPFACDCWCHPHE